MIKEIMNLKNDIKSFLVSNKDGNIKYDDKTKLMLERKAKGLVKEEINNDLERFYESNKDKGRGIEYDDGVKTMFEWEDKDIDKERPNLRALHIKEYGNKAKIKNSSFVVYEYQLKGADWRIKNNKERTQAWKNVIEPIQQYEQERKGVKDTRTIEKFFQDMPIENKIKFIIDNKYYVNPKTLIRVSTKKIKREINMVYKEICYRKAYWGIKFGKGDQVTLIKKTKEEEKEQEKLNARMARENMQEKALHNIQGTKTMVFLTNTLPRFTSQTNENGKREESKEARDIDKIIKARKIFFALLDKELKKKGLNRKYRRKIKSIRTLEQHKSGVWHSHIVFLNIDLFEVLGHKTVPYDKKNKKGYTTIIIPRVFELWFEAVGEVYTNEVKPNTVAQNMSVFNKGKEFTKQCTIHEGQKEKKIIKNNEYEKKVIQYLTKYLEKARGSKKVGKGRRLFSFSTNCKNPIKRVLIINLTKNEGEEYMKKLGFEITNISKYDMLKQKGYIQKLALKVVLEENIRTGENNRQYYGGGHKYMQKK